MRCDPDNEIAMPLPSHGNLTILSLALCQGRRLERGPKRGWSQFADRPWTTTKNPSTVTQNGTSTRTNY
jgi:hypothetical protein